jgi:uncharacterized protein (DUF1501 family)
VPFAGSRDLSRSHFQSQDTIELGQPLDAPRGYESGFMGRLASVLEASRPIAFSRHTPLAFRAAEAGAKPLANVALGPAGAKPPAVDARQSALIAEMYRDTQLGTPVSEGFAMRESVMRELGGEMEAAGRNAVNARGFELQARRIARLMQGEYNLGFVDIGGWDTHVGEGGASGYLAIRLEELGRGLAAFAEAMGGAWRDTVVVVLSEFGRTFRENGNRGTDHGHANAMMIVGGGIRGGKVYGKWPGLAPEQRFEGRDLAVTTDFRSVFSEVVRGHLGLADTRPVFPGFQNAQTLGFLA